jgi:hypothetical protein
MASPRGKKRRGGSGGPRANHGNIGIDAPLHRC